MDSNQKQAELRSRIRLYGPNGERKQDPFLRKMKHKQLLNRELPGFDSFFRKRETGHVANVINRATEDRMLRQTTMWEMSQYSAARNIDGSPLPTMPAESNQKPNCAKATESNQFQVKTKPQSLPKRLTQHTSKNVMTAGSKLTEMTTPTKLMTSNSGDPVMAFGNNDDIKSLLKQPRIPYTKSERRRTNAN